MSSNQETDIEAPEALVQDAEVPMEPEDDAQSQLALDNFTPINFSNTNRRIIDLYRAYKEDKDIDPRPAFQRGYVWERLIPLTQACLYVVAASRQLAPRLSSDCLA